MPRPHDEPHTLPSAFAYSLTGGVGTWACSTFFLTNVEDIAAWHVALGGSCATALAVVGVHHIYRNNKKTTGFFRGTAKAVAATIGAGATAWTTWAQTTGHPNSLASLGALAGGTILTWYTTGLMTHWLDHRDDVHHAQLEEEQRIADMNFWERVLDAAGVRGAKTSAPAQDKLGNETVGIAVPSASLSKITEAGIEEKIAVEANRLDNGMTLPADAVKLYRLQQAGQFQMRIERSRDSAVLAKVIPYVPPQGPVDIAEDFEIGQWENGEPIVINLLKLHVEIVAMTQVGKSSFLSVLLDRIAASYNGVAWVGGNWKLNDLLSPRLEPLKHGHQPTEGYIAHGTNDTLEMLATAFEEASRRYTIPALQRPNRPTREMPAIFCIIDEASFLMRRRKDKVLCHDGIYRNASELVDVLTRGATGVFVQVILATQSGLNADYGDHGGDIKRQLKLKIVMRIENPSDLRRVIPGHSRDLKPEKLLYPGVAYVKIDEVVLMAGKLAFLDMKFVPQLVVQRQPTRVDLPIEAGAAFTVGARWERPQSEPGEPEKDQVLVQTSAWERRWIGDVETFLEYATTGTRPAGQQSTVAAAVTYAGRRRPEADQPKSIEDALSALGAVAQRHRTEKREQGVKKVLGADEKTIEESFAELTADFGQPVPELLAKLIEAFPGREFVSTDDLAKAVGMESAALGLMLSRPPYSITRDAKAVRRPEYDGKPTRGFFMEPLHAAAEEFRTGKRPPA
ncbi:hypothetical protein DMC64_41535 [Amycolatopsis sp. WAC 04197]|uniref:hypothetical protein n=1 Tax=Amycolatopsis sp. WAC 04197 TaxID=2203199 RepID=UPI000F775175|nr:hypothetical protein [Amycolatopsis sp. WAC 04197]RSN38553.1 hypothetical protein DMC64_41535 [Amycolatopsis sp. WAC 04197]